MATDYEKPDTSVDCVLLTLGEGGLRVLLLPRDKEPFAGTATLIGAYVRPQIDRTLEDTVQRALRDKAGIDGVYLEQLGTFGGAERDPRGWSIAVAYVALIQTSIADEAERRSGVRFERVLVGALPPLPFDHAEIVAAAVERVRAKASYSTLPAFLLPEAFTLAEYKQVVEQVTGRIIDDGAFRKKFDAIPGLVKIEGAKKGGTNSSGTGKRPSQLYRIAAESDRPRMLTRLF
ncbi:hypothetical protein BHAOGJBA_4503 [Methylobacterium hispanicum]|uniref:NrtR DNA-binding winged helix domain-containing protein n=1 Tax=Methylobacterium hispanicum TaxID=270350 RepID=A0AAV4ZSQ4_9HYPH|nr:NUDIX hydrolase [Methylobacterium hispanicum]GJD90959.1 hypothetical protein BHAOGJBA_4503 [Methylobacterium hispanicum]